MCELPLTFMLDVALPLTGRACHLRVWRPMTRWWIGCWIPTRSRLIQICTCSRRGSFASVRSSIQLFVYRKGTVTISVEQKRLQRRDNIAFLTIVTRLRMRCHIWNQGKSCRQGIRLFLYSSAAWCTGPLMNLYGCRLGRERSCDQLFFSNACKVKACYLSYCK